MDQGVGLASDLVNSSLGFADLHFPQMFKNTRDVYVAKAMDLVKAARQQSISGTFTAAKEQTIFLINSAKQVLVAAPRPALSPRPRLLSRDNFSMSVGLECAGFAGAYAVVRHHAGAAVQGRRHRHQRAGVALRCALVCTMAPPLATCDALASLHWYFRWY